MSEERITVGTCSKGKFVQNKKLILSLIGYFSLTQMFLRAGCVMVSIDFGELAWVIIPPFGDDFAV